MARSFLQGYLRLAQAADSQLPAKWKWFWSSSVYSQIWSLCKCSCRVNTVPGQEVFCVCLAQSRLLITKLQGG